MKPFSLCAIRAPVAAVAVLFVNCCSSSSLEAQINSWTSSASGSWESSSWSLGLAPAANQTVLITNSGWKAVEISANTTANYPQSLIVDSITLLSPTNSFNTLLMNFAGTANPLIANSIFIGSNSAMTLHTSALQLANGGAGLSIAGEFTQSDYSLVAADHIDVGYYGPGVYNLNSGTLTASDLFVEGDFNGVINQYGGTNQVGILHLNGGQYNLFGGEFSGTIYLNPNSTFRQQGGTVHAAVTVYRGAYSFEGGVNFGGAVVPVNDGYSAMSGSGTAIQTGGTNFGALDIGSAGVGSYVLSNGVSIAPSLTIGPEGTFVQAGGNQAVTGQVFIESGFVARNQMGYGIFNLNGGTLTAGSLGIDGYYNQSGGTNSVAGDVTVYGSLSLFVHSTVTGGTLAANNLTADRRILQSGGLVIVTNQLTFHATSLSGTDSYGPDYDLNGGQVVTSNLTLSGAVFRFANQSVSQSGILELDAATLKPGTGSHQLGALKLDSYYPNTHSFLQLPQNAPCVIRFADSSRAGWTNSTATLTIENWSGSATGGGEQQVIFGTSTDALTSEQLAKITFANPAGFSAGNYTARILSTGEIVPAVGTPQLLNLALSLAPDDSPQLHIQSTPGKICCVEVSTDLVHWVTWTNHTCTNGTVSLVDADAKNFPQRFYRAHVLE